MLSGKAPVHPPSTDPLIATVRSQDDIFGEAQLWDQTFGAAVLGDEGDGFRHLELPAQRQQPTGHGAKQLALPITFDRRHTDNFPFVHLQRGVPHREAVAALPGNLQGLESNEALSRGCPPSRHRA